MIGFIIWFCFTCAAFGIAGFARAVKTSQEVEELRQQLDTTRIIVDEVTMNNLYLRARLGFVIFTLMQTGRVLRDEDRPH